MVEVFSDQIEIFMEGVNEKTNGGGTADPNCLDDGENVSFGVEDLRFIEAGVNFDHITKHG